MTVELDQFLEASGVAFSLLGGWSLSSSSLLRLRFCLVMSVLRWATSCKYSQHQHKEQMHTNTPTNAHAQDLTCLRVTFSSLSFFTCWIFCFWFWWPISRAYISLTFWICVGTVTHTRIGWELPLISHAHSLTLSLYLPFSLFSFSLPFSLCTSDCASDVWDNRSLLISSSPSICSCSPGKNRWMSGQRCIISVLLQLQVLHHHCSPGKVAISSPAQHTCSQFHPSPPEPCQASKGATS